MIRIENKAWNEWGENMSAEPSREKRFQYLESIARFLINSLNKFSK